ncbi:restriction endonuclease [Rheinheimera sp. WS51]|uniref:restriction endonuclease n=1 Tax=Rheinheimera sp. WS51 TaxID=3425886 RepID=UPI003D89F867
MYWLFDKNKQKAIRQQIDELVLKLSIVAYKPPHADQIFPFQGRKAIEHAKTVICALSEPGEVICDPFVGSGSFGYAAGQLERQVYVNEYEPFTFRMMVSAFQAPEEWKIDENFKAFVDIVAPITDYYYRSKCVCGHEIVVDSLFYDREPLSYRNITGHERLGPNGENVIYRGKCKCQKCGRTEKFFDDYDQQVLDLINEEAFEFFDFRFIENSRINLSKKFLDYKALFSKRSQIVASKIWAEIQYWNVDVQVKRFYEDLFLSIVPLLKYKDYRSKSQDLHCPRNMLRENNPLNMLVKQYAKRKKAIYSYGLVGAQNVKCSNLDFRTFLKNLEPNSVNLVVTDPPWQDGSAYFERAQLFHPWIGYDLKKDLERLEKEVVVSNSPERPSKNNDISWWSDINELFFESRRTLEVGRFLVLYFRPVPAKAWISNFNRLKLIARKNGFEPLLTIDLSNNDPSMRIQQSAHYAFSSDLILTFIKLSEDERRYYFKDYDIDELGFRAAVSLQDKLMRSFSKREWLEESFESFKAKGLVELHLPRNKDFVDRTFQRVCESNRDGFFLPKASTPYADEIFNVPYIERVSLYVPYVIEELLARSDTFTFDQFLLKIAEFVENGTRAIIEDILGDGEDNISSLLELYAEPIAGGKYFTKRPLPQIPANIANLLELDPYEFESFIAKLLELEGYKNVAVSGRAGDRGVDVRCNDSVGNLVIVQCKRYTKSNIGSTPIQRLHSFGMTRKASKMICITTTDYTPDGIDEARITGVELINRDGLEILVHKHRMFDKD